MSATRRIILPVTLDGAGACDLVTDTIQHGLLDRLVYTKNNFANGSVMTLTLKATGEAVWTETGVNASAVRAPRQATHNNLGAVANYAATFPVLDKIAISNDQLRLVITGGGAGNLGTFHFVLA